MAGGTKQQNKKTLTKQRDERNPQTDHSSLPDIRRIPDAKNSGRTGGLQAALKRQEWFHEVKRQVLKHVDTAVQALKTTTTEAKKNKEA